MSQLDDRAWVTRLDPKGILATFENFPNQCREGLMIGREVEVSPLDRLPSVVCLTGMGGSAAGGDIVRALFEAHGVAPFIVNRDYHLPNFVGVGDLVFCASYSGNTEETLSAYDDAKKSGARIVAVTSGGKLADRAEADGFTIARIPGGFPPRTALGFMLMPVVAICNKLKLLPEFDYEKAFAMIETCIKEWSVENTGENLAKKLATELHGKLGVIYGLGSWQGLVANRWKGQINENAKCLAIHNAFPEMNHNEILGWVEAAGQGIERAAVVFLRGGPESEKMRARAKVTARLIGGRAESFDAVASGDNLFEWILSLTNLADFVSTYLAALNGVDPENIDSINTLKAELSKVP